jgi:DM DNA binding domain
MVNKIQQNHRPQKEITKPTGSISRSSSSSSSSKSSSSKPALSNRMCAQCQNHGLKIPVRGHKRFCKFRYTIKMMIKCIICNNIIFTCKTQPGRKKLMQTKMIKGSSSHSQESFYSAARGTPHNFNKFTIPFLTFK